ncbi:unnamed protein product [Effrenium voratum]|nr:unnamed protein product [Effrenium voratum]
MSDAKAQGVADAVMGQSNTDAGRMEVLKQLMEQQSVGDWRFLRLETSSSSSEEPVESEKPKIEVRRMNRVEMQEELKAQGEPVEPGATVNQLRSQLVTARKSVETPMGAAEVQEPLPDKVETPVDAAQKQDKVETEGQEPLPDKVKTPVDAAGDQEPPHDMVETADAAQKPEESRGVVWSLPTLPGSARFQQLAAHCPPARKKNKSLYVDQWLFEPINVHALEGAGSLRAFGQLGLRGRIADLLSRDTENSGMILTVYRDSGACHGCKARLVSGVHLEDYEELGKNKSKNKRQKVDPETETNEEELYGRFRELPQVVSTLTEMRIDSYDATRSAFSFGRLFKELCRTGLPVCDIDQTFSVGYSLLHRHADAQQVRYLLQNREACYAEVGVPDRDEVKKFFNGILMGGGSEHCERFMLRYKLEHLPPFVFILRQEMCKLAARDAQAYPELAQELSKDGGNWRSRLLELLHELREREVTDMMAEHAGAKVCGWEYDGVLFACPPEEHAKLTESLQHKIGLPLKHKAYRSLEEILAEYQRLHPTLDWQSRDDDWFQVEQDRRLLRAYLVKGTEGVDRLVAAILPHHVAPDGRLVRECFKNFSCSKQHMETAFFCTVKRRWQLESPAHVEELLCEYASQEVKNCLPPTWRGLPPASVYRRESMRSVVKTAANRALYDKSFQLQVDGDKYRGLLMTQDGCLIDVRTMDAQLAKQEHVITKCLGVTYPRELFAMLDRDLDLEECLQQVKDFESGVGQEYGAVDMPPELGDKLLKLFEHPALEACKVLYSCWENMAVTLWLMKWAAHRLCGTSQLEEFHIYLGGGKNGKSWWIAQLQALFGTYCAMPDSDLLTRRFNSQQATPQHMELRGARLLPFPEMNASHRLQADTLKLYSEHKTVIHARNLFADYVSFRVQFGLVMCSNERLHMSLDGGTDRRLSVAEWPIQFCQVPRASHERLVQVGLKDEQRLADNSPGLLYVLLKVFKVFGAVQDTLVRPWPLWVEQATRSYLQGDSVEFVWESFVETWEMASRPSMECAGYGVVSDACVAFARTKNVGVSAAGSHFKQAMLRHKHNGRYVAKFLNENQCFNQPKGSA